MGIWIIVWIQKPSHHFLQTFPPLRMFKIVFRHSSLYAKQLSLFCLLWLISANFAKTLVWKTWIWRQIMTSQTTHTNYKWHHTPRNETSHENFLRTPLNMQKQIVITESCLSTQQFSNTGKSLRFWPDVGVSVSTKFRRRAERTAQWKHDFLNQYWLHFGLKVVSMLRRPN